MKKIFSMMAACALAMGFTACESIPSPYEIFDEIIDGIATDIYYESAACYTGWNLELGAEQTIQYNPWSQGSSYTQATGYQKWDGADAKSNKEAEGFLVSPKFKTTAKDNNVVFSFDYCIGYANNDKDFAKHTKIYVSKTYNDGAIDLNDWEEINWTATHTSTDWTLANTGNIALPAEYMNQDNVHIAFWFYAPAAGSATFEIKNFVIETGVAGEQPDQPGTGDQPSGEPAGDGSQANPFNVAATIDFVNKLEKNAKSDPVYIKGIVKKFKDGEEPGNSYGNATFYIVDSEGAAQDFYCYRVMGPGNKNFTSADQLKVGDEVVIYGPLTLYSSSYGDTPETVQKECYVYSINGKSEGGNTDTPDTPSIGAKGSGTAADPYNVAGVLAYTKGLAADVNSDKEVYFTGIVKNFKAGEEPGNQYGNATFYIIDEGGSEDFYCFRVLGKDGAKFTEGAEAPAVGDKVTIRGLVVNYKGNTPETVSGKAYVEAIVKGEGGNVTPGGGEDTPVIDEDKNGDFESWSGSTPLNWTTSSTAGNATLKQSTDAHSGKYSVEVGGTASGNKRLGRKEMTLEAGTYTMTFWVKAASSAGGSVRPGFVPVTNGAVGSYVYGDYTNDLGTDWVQVTHTFDIPTTGIYSIVIMNSKNPGANVLIDDFVLMKGDAKVISSRRRARK